MYKRAAHMKPSQDYGDIPLPTVLQVFQVGRVGKVPHGPWWLTAVTAVPFLLMVAA